MKNNIRIYRVKSKYIKYLSMYQEHIFAQDAEKDNRKYVGVVFEIKGMKYFAPLSQIEIFVSKGEQEQAKIAKCFENLDNIITLHQRKRFYVRMEECLCKMKRVVPNYFPNIIKNGLKFIRKVRLERQQWTST